MSLNSKALILGALFLGLSSSAWGNNALTGETEASVDKRKWTAIFDMAHTFQTLDTQFNAREDQESFTDFTLRVDYDLGNKQFLRVVQPLQKRYEIDSDTQEWAAGETLITHIWATPWTIKGAKIQWFNGLTLPVSEQAVDDSKITHFNTQLRFNRMFGKVFLSFRPFARYHWYEFRNTVDGRNLPLLTYGASLMAFAPITKKLSIIGFTGYNFVNESNSALANGIAQAAPEDGTYFALGILNYQINKNLSVYGLYSQGDRYIEDGRYELWAYDPEATRYAAGLTVTY